MKTAIAALFALLCFAAHADDQPTHRDVEFASCINRVPVGKYLNDPKGAAQLVIERCNPELRDWMEECKTIGGEGLTCASRALLMTMYIRGGK